MKHSKPNPSPTPGVYANSSIESVMPSNHLILCLPLLLPLSIFLSIRVFSNESACHNRWPKYWSFSFNISPSNEYSGLISFRIDRLDLLAVQGALKSLLQYHSSKASIWREGGLGWGTHVNPWLIHVNVWQKPLQYYKVISLQLIKINEKKKAPIFRRSPFFTVQFSHPYITTGKTIALTRWTFVGKVTSLLF